MIDCKLLIALCVGIAFSLPAAAKLYKWVDEKGVTHYGETIPPEYANRDRTELSKSGRRLKKDYIPTPAEKKAAREEEERKIEEAKIVREQKRHDTMLLNTYSDLKEIDLARNRNLQQVNARIVNDKSQLKMVDEKLLALQKESEGYTGANKEVPASLQDEIQQVKASADKMQQRLDKSMAEKAAVEARYDADKERYSALTGKK